MYSKTLEYELLSATAEDLSKGDGTEMLGVPNAKGSRYRLSNVKSTTTVLVVSGGCRAAVRIDLLSSAQMRYTNAGQESLSLMAGMHPKARMTGPLSATTDCGKRHEHGECMT